MEARLFRLTILIALLSLVGFGSYAAYSHYQAKGAEELGRSRFQAWKEWGDRCHDMDRQGDLRTSACVTFEQVSVFLDAINERQSEYDDRARYCLVAAVVVPLLVFFLFYSGRWVVCGRLLRK